ncbi:intercellular trafficking and secretion [Rhizopus stolonifer]|uniref:Sorting nexin-4 n=1 Tax=Rhizopus stolonifer TaxID=4846 RepID=A0A367KJS3_RHIST|nr:intercellular trafficking and secretion [Rhizopus stolonifer]
MSDDFENVIQWDVHTDTQTPQLDIKDPLSQFTEERLQSPSPTSLSSLNADNKNTTEVPTSPTFPVPVASASHNETQSISQKKEETLEILPMTITVDEPRKHNDPTQGTYVTYFVSTQTTLETFKNTTQPNHVRRRFQDFVWLHNALTLEYPACIIPPLPDKHRFDLQKDYTSFANSIQGLSALETNIKKTLHQFAETCKAYSKVMSEMSEKEELLFLNEIHELLAYCYAAKDVLKARDQKQLDFEELSRYLDQAAVEKERILHPKFNDRTNIAEYVTDKINEVRGISMQQARREKLSRLESKIKELQEEVTRANDESHKFSIQVVKEFDLFQRTKIVELKQGLLAYADCHIDFYQKGMSVWEKILPVLESMDNVRGDGESVV